MSSDAAARFFEMGGYGLYVWGAFAMVALALVWEALTLIQRRRRALLEWQEGVRLGGMDGSAADADATIASRTS